VGVACDAEAGQSLAKDVGFLLGAGDVGDVGDPAPRGAARLRRIGDDEDSEDVLVLTTSESSPYADVNPDRRSALSRMATLGHLAAGRPCRVLVVAATALARKLVPREVVRAHTHRVVPDVDIDREALVRDLTQAGYLR